MTRWVLALALALLVTCIACERERRDFTSRSGVANTTRLTDLQAGGDCLGVDLPPGTYHGLVVLEPDSMLFECKAGPYRPVGEGEHAHWAPREGDEGVAEYQAWMRAQFD